ncbi:hypothetical protein FHX10_006548 [Rhizobium sp. BK591]|uniref:hypothetical protein n=1 Tax=Rhizobium sp. BK591 TaxID=2586985 RepID=UPI0010511F9E|nr:hypothetical protein [Rhizobium sp. BK591]MBB3746995.1 hypothetical protein [Rhizobium sp. BK591]
MDVREEWDPFAKWIGALEQRTWLYLQDNFVDDRPCGALEVNLLRELRHAYDSCFDFIQRSAARGLKGFAECDLRLQSGRRVTAELFIPDDVDAHPRTEMKRLVKDWVLSIGLLEAEITYLLADFELWIRNKTDLAFKHLQRLISVDARLKADWAAAFGKREEACERLGATHLLWHGLWAFKVDSQGARTDLVTFEPIDDRIVGASGGALVLTEWKKIKEVNRRAIEQAFASAKGQALNYVSGALGAIELKSQIHLVAVTMDPIPKHEMPEETVEQGKTIRYVNIVIDPPVPSRGKY